MIAVLRGIHAQKPLTLTKPYNTLLTYMQNGYTINPNINATGTLASKRRSRQKIHLDQENLFGFLLKRVRQ